MARSQSAVSAHDVARAIRERMPHAGDVKVQKLLYYCQGWHLTWLREPLFHEQVEAWAMGPVIGELWADEKHGRPVPEPRALSEDSLRVVDYVIGRYGGQSGRDLIRLTHLEGPWKHVSEAGDRAGWPSPEIPLEAMQDWFQQDEEYLSFMTEVERLRGRSDVHSFDPPERTPALVAAVNRALSGEQVRESRPT